MHLVIFLNHPDRLSASWLNNGPADLSMLLVESRLAIEDLLPADPRLLDHALERIAVKWGNLVAEEYGLLVDIEFRDVAIGGQCRDIQGIIVV